jgi:hypothetical protein
MPGATSRSWGAMSSAAAAENAGMVPGKGGAAAPEQRPLIEWYRGRRAANPFDCEDYKTPQSLGNAVRDLTLILRTDVQQPIAAVCHPTDMLVTRILSRHALAPAH